MSSGKEWEPWNPKQGAFLARYILSDKTIGSTIQDTINMTPVLKHYKYVDQTHYSIVGEYAKLLKGVKAKLDEFGLEVYIKRYNQIQKEFIRFCKQLEKVRDTTPNNEIAALFEELQQQYALVFGFVSHVFFYIEHISAEIKRLLNELGSKNIEKDFASLLMSKEADSYTKVHQKRLLKLAIKINSEDKAKKDYIKGLDYTKSEIKKELEDITNDYNWMGILFFLGKPFTIDDFYEKVKLMLDKNPEEKIKILKKQGQDAKNDFALTMKKLDISKKSELFTELIKLRKIAQVREQQLEYVSKGEYSIYNFLEIIAKKMRISHEDIINCSPDEISLFLKKGILPEKKRIEARKKRFGMIKVIGKPLQIFEGNEVEEISEETSDLNIKSLNILKGTVASKGIVRGYAKICKSPTETNKMKKGDILIAKMTTPDYIMGIEKASAILTEAGGLTSHAAIISREFGIPCIVGIKNVTLILKDDDTIEVDANKGAVRILK